jgi:hypothetical protein
VLRGYTPVAEVLLGAQALLPKCGIVDELLEVAAVSGVALPRRAIGTCLRP